ncbi:MAG: hypothetical protein U0800_23315 [Isosphaeraceae bacterium]
MSRTVMKRDRAGGTALAVGLLALAAAGCSDVPEAGSIQVPALSREGPTVNPNNPGGDTVIPEEDRAPAKGARKR